MVIEAEIGIFGYWVIGLLSYCDWSDAHINNKTPGKINVIEER
jgi:hypothetical protein